MKCHSGHFHSATLFHQRVPRRSALSSPPKPLPVRFYPFFNLCDQSSRLKRSSSSALYLGNETRGGESIKRRGGNSRRVVLAAIMGRGEVRFELIAHFGKGTSEIIQVKAGRESDNGEESLSLALSINDSSPHDLVQKARLLGLSRKSRVFNAI